MFAQASEELEECLGTLQDIMKHLEESLEELNELTETEHK